jgi:hypothetical protein
MLRPPSGQQSSQAPAQAQESHTPDPNFAFPVNSQDSIDALLRKEVDAPFVTARRAKPVVRIVEDEKPKIKTEMPTTTPKAEASGVSIDLPSKFHYYDFKDLYVLPMRVPQLAKISAAHNTGDLQKQVEAISSLLSTSSGDSTNLAFKLTMADYMAVLYYLRMTSFSKPQMRVTSFCEDEGHHAKVKAGELPKESLKIETVVFKTDLRTIYLDAAPDPEHYSITVDGITVPFGPETLADTIQFMDHKDWTDEAFQYKSRIAAVLKLDQATGRIWTWDQRVQFVDEYMDPESAVKAIEFGSMMDDYGVVETVATTCKGCGSKGVTTITCDPLSFLSPQF